MVQQLYTPFLSQAGAAIGQGLAKRGQRQREQERNRLVQSAYMDQPGALQELYAVDPQAAAQVESQKRQKEQTTLSTEAKKRQALQENKQLVDETLKQAAKLDTVEEAQSFIDQSIERNRELFGDVQFDNLTPEMFQSIKKIYGGKPSEGFAGTSMDAQVSNLLVKGVDDPKFRETPEYARAWQLANEPEIIRTPTGDLKLPPDLPSIFKAPGKVDISPKAQMKTIEGKAEVDAEINDQLTKKDDKPAYIPGTERPEKFTEGEKLSAGFFERMKDSEDRINELATSAPSFDPSALKEVILGLSNITASKEYQLYRQASSDWIRAKLRKESGAVIGKDEMDDEYKTYFPVLGDTKEVIEQKKRARDIAVESMKKNAGSAIKEEGKGKQETSEKPMEETTSKTPPTITSDAEYEALPPGTEFIAPDGSRRRKP